MTDSSFCFFRYFCTSFLETPAPSFSLRVLKAESFSLYPQAQTKVSSSPFLISSIFLWQLGQRALLSLATVPILTHQQPRILAVHREHPLAAARAFGIGQIVVSEGAFGRANLTNQCVRILLNFLKEYCLFAFPFGDVSKLHFPLSCKLRFFPFFSIRKE